MFAFVSTHAHTYTHFTHITRTHTPAPPQPWKKLLHLQCTCTKTQTHQEHLLGLLDILGLVLLLHGNVLVLLLHGLLHILHLLLNVLNLRLLDVLHLIYIYMCTCDFPNADRPRTVLPAGRPKKRADKLLQKKSATLPSDPFIGTTLLPVSGGHWETHDKLKDLWAVKPASCMITGRGGNGDLWLLL